MVYPWQVLSSWAPFHIDALGIITLLGADEVDAWLGRLALSKWLEYMPLLGGYVFATDQFRKQQSSYLLYNITSGIVTSDLAGWFTRWMQAQEFEVTRSLVYWDVIEEPRIWWSYHLLSGAISFVLTGFLVVLAVVSEDWYGFANAIATIISIAVRAFLLQANRNAIDIAVLGAECYPGTFRFALKQWEKQENDPSGPRKPRPNEDCKPNGGKWRPEEAKFLIVLPDSRAVTMIMPEKLVIPVFTKNIISHSSNSYHLVRWVGWIAFGMHIVAIGMAKLPTQLYVIAIMVIPTVLACVGFGCDDSKLRKRCHRFLKRENPPNSYVTWVGSHLRATVFEWPNDVEFIKDEKTGIRRRHQSEKISPGKRSTKRQDLYAWLNLNHEEKESFETWHLLPHLRNHDYTWDSDFEHKRDLINQNAPDIKRLQEEVLMNWDQKHPKADNHRHRLPDNQDSEKGDLYKVYSREDTNKSSV